MVEYSFMFITSARLTLTFLSPLAFPILLTGIFTIPESGAETIKLTGKESNR